MVQKKDRSRFSIKFRENDPAHSMTIRILENQGQRNIAPFLVNAVLHYVQCNETPDVSHMLVENPQPVLDRQEIEDIVWGILRQEGIVMDNVQKDVNKSIYTEEQECLHDKEGRNKYVQSKNVIGDDMRSMIARTLSAFRNEEN